MNQPGFPPADVHERDASDWQGTRHRYPEAGIDHAGIDLPLQAWLAQRAGPLTDPPPAGDGLEPAPGQYVLAP